MVEHDLGKRTFMALAKTEQGVNWLIRLAMAVLVLGLGFVLVKTIITYTNPESAWTQPVITSQSAGKNTQQNSQTFTFVTDPFNRAVAESPEVLDEVGQDAPETSLNLKLTGRTTAKTRGSVIILTPDNKTGNYRVGDEIVSGVTLEAVNKDFVVLDVDGQIERLTFERGENTGLIQKTNENDEASKTKVRVNAPVRPLATTSTSIGASSNIGALFQQVSLRRVMKDGRMIGYSVKPNRPGVSLKPFGFAKGDVVTAIGSTDITRGRPDFIRLFENAALSGGTEVTVLRNGQIKIIKLGTP